MLPLSMLRAAMPLMMLFAALLLMRLLLRFLMPALPGFAAAVPLMLSLRRFRSARFAAAVLFSPCLRDGFAPLMFF